MDCNGYVRYNSVWDWSTWLIIALVMGCCLWTLFLDDNTVTAVICGVCLLFVAVLFKSVYYKIEDDRLIVCCFFSQTAYPIDKIDAVALTKSALSAPATSLTQRIAITFTDRAVLKGSMPLVISPVRRDEFVERLCAINPSIKNMTVW